MVFEVSRVAPCGPKDT